MSFFLLYNFFSSQSSHFGVFYSQLTEPATLLFEHPVDVNTFTDYLQYVQNPMDFSTIDKKIKQGAYVYAEGKVDVHYVCLVFTCC